MSEEPEIVVGSREELLYLLTEAAEIEHGLMCCYLFAAFSLKASPSEGISESEAKTIAGWRRSIIGVAIDEMVHLSLVNNTLAALGGPAYFQRPNFPVAPGYHPGGVVVSLAPFSKSTLDHFVFLERPEGVDLPDGETYAPAPPYVRSLFLRDALVATAQDYSTVGHLYRSIQQGLGLLSERLGEANLFCGTRASQVGPDMVGLQGLSEVFDLASGQRAIETIVEQGEGAPGHTESSHYAKFLAIRDQYAAMLAADPAFAPARPVATSPVQKRPFDARDKVFVDAPESARILDLGNAAYGLMLRLLGRGFGQCDDPRASRTALIDGGIDTMRVVTALAEKLTTMPASPSRPGVNAGLSFSLPRSIGALPQQQAAWTILVERTREIAEGCARAGEAAAATDLHRIADTLSTARPKKAATTMTEAVKAPAEASSPVEVAKGSKLTILFEGRRCIHSRHCVLSAPTVFKANTPGEWIFPDNEDVESLVHVAQTCPSGAITYERLDGGLPEPKPKVNVLRVRENGPLAIHAELQIAGEERRLRATLCRCGASKQKPYCDGSHVAIGFAASGEPKTVESQPLEARGGVLSVTPTKNGPLVVNGNLEICCNTGRTINRVTKTALCRCGGSSNKPYCDGTHAKIGFSAP